MTEQNVQLTTREEAWYTVSKLSQIIVQIFLTLRFKPPWWT